MDLAYSIFMEWIAHAGWHEPGYEKNSREALQAACETEFRIEFDVLWHGGELLVAHSEEELSPDTIYLTEALEILQTADNPLSLDIKNQGGEEELSKLLRKFPLQQPVLLCGHYQESLMRIRGPYQRGWSLPSPEVERYDFTEILQRTYVDGFMLHHSLLSRETLDLVHRWGGWVHAWTIDKEEDLLLLRDLSLDGITSNYPQRMQTAWNSL